MTTHTPAKSAMRLGPPTPQLQKKFDTLQAEGDAALKVARDKILANVSPDIAALFKEYECLRTCYHSLYFFILPFPAKDHVPLIRHHLKNVTELMRKVGEK